MFNIAVILVFLDIQKSNRKNENMNFKNFCPNFKKSFFGRGLSSLPFFHINPMYFNAFNNLFIYYLL